MGGGGSHRTMFGAGLVGIGAECGIHSNCEEALEIEGKKSDIDCNAIELAGLNDTSDTALALKASTEAGLEESICVSSKCGSGAGADNEQYTTAKASAEAQSEENNDGWICPRRKRPNANASGDSTK